MMSRFDRARLLLVAEFSTGGSVESLLCLAKGLDAARFETTILFLYLPERAMQARFENAGVKVLSLYPALPGATAESRPPELPKFAFQARVRRIFGRTAESIYASIKYGIKYLRYRLPITLDLRRRIKELQPDLVHFNSSLDWDTPGIFAARLCGVPCVSHVRSFGTNTFLNLFAARFVSAFICISTAIRDDLVASGVNPERAVVVSNGVDVDKFRVEMEDVADLRAEFGYDDVYVFGLVGRLVDWKGQDDLIRALALARRSGARVCGLIIGSGDNSPAGKAYEDRLHTLVSELGLGEYVTFAGHRTDVPRLMKAVDAVVCPSSQPEPFGRVIIESMAVGTPVIATRAGGVPDIITDGHDGIMVPINDPDSLAAAMIDLSSDPELAEQLGAAGMKTVSRCFTLEHYVQGVCGVYDDILSTDRGGDVSIYERDAAR